jgi:hypothetical protein
MVTEREMIVKIQEFDDGKKRQDLLWKWILLSIFFFLFCFVFCFLRQSAFRIRKEH